MLDARRRPTKSTLTIAFLAADSPEARRALGRLAKRYPQVAPSKADAIVALGGDGMMLETLHRFMGRGTPIYGMNCGTIGFLMNKYNEADLPAREDRAGQEGADRPRRAGERGQHIEQERLAARVTRVQENREVSNLLRDLVCGDGDGGAHAERHRRQDRRGDDRAVHEVMERIADHHRRDGAFMHFAVMRMTVPPEDELFENEEEQDAAEQRREHAAGRKRLE